MQAQQVGSGLAANIRAGKQSATSSWSSSAPAQCGAASLALPTHFFWQTSLCWGQSLRWHAALRAVVGR